jgi:plasmid maintenance system antidote protein VapI
MVLMTNNLHGGEESSDSVPWREVFPHFNTGIALRGGRKKEGLTQKELARLIGVSQNHISEMEHGKRPIGKDMARRLAEALKVDYRVFL